MVGFINLKHGKMSVLEYFLKFTYCLSILDILVFNSTDEMNRFLVGVFNLVNEECHLTILHSDMNNPRLMVHDQYMEELNMRGRVE